ncbi:T9SS type A sorting domain-containing protein [Flavobacteriaceae bacterium F08102]|nr:T9SS type A sorting domain-containing protein [Flavobacteriaceae bacterium F08102]
MTRKLLLVLCMTLVVQGSFGKIANTNTNTPPIIFNFRIESTQADKVYFDSNVPLVGTSTAGFIINDKSISGINLVEGSTTGHYFSVNSEFSFWDNNTIRYEGGSDLASSDGIPLTEFTLSYIDNLLPEPDASQYRYVSATAKGGGDGLSEDSPWTFKEAVSKVQPGQTVWLKAGNYGNVQTQMNKKGTKNNPIKFIGYKNSIGDITENYYKYQINNPYGGVPNTDNWSASEMPTLTGSSVGYGNVALWLFSCEYVIFRNIQMTNYAYGFRANVKGGVKASNNNIIWDNFNAKNFGNLSNQNASALAMETYDVNTYPKKMVGNTNLRCINSNFLNNLMVAVQFFGDGSNLIENVKSYNDRTGQDRQDYHIVVNGNNNIVRKCHVENFNNTIENRSSHGITIRGSHRLDSDYNLIELCTSRNNQEGFAIRNYGTEYNVIKDCYAGNNVIPNTTNDEYKGGFWIWGGSNYNIIERCIAENVATGIGFKDNTEENVSPVNYEIGHDNIIRNSVFRNLTFHGIQVWATSPDGSSGWKKGDLINNKIINCTFDNINNVNPRLGGFYRNGSATTSSGNVKNLQIINCSITNVRNSMTHPTGVGYSIDELTFSYTNFYNSWGIEPGEGNISVDPKFVNPEAGDYTLQEDSPLIDKGIKDKDVNFDYNHTPRIYGSTYDIGAFEFQSNEPTLTEDLTICEGESVDLVASGGDTYLWSTGEETFSISVSPTVTTTYSVEIMNADGSSTHTVTVTVNEGPTAEAGEDITICAGSEIVLTATGGDTYEWSTGETTQSIVVSPDETTTYTVTTKNNGCETTAVDSVDVIVVGAPNFTAGDDQTICSGTEVTLLASGSDNYVWSTGDETDAITVSPTTTTTYTVTTTVGTCTFTDEVTIHVTGDITVDAGDDQTICEGGSVTLTAVGGENHRWSNGEIGASITVSPTVTTTYKVNVDNICGAEEIFDEVTVFVEEMPNLEAGDDVRICEGESVTLTATGADNYVWSTGETTASITVIPDETTIYTVTATNGTCVIEDSVQVLVDELPTVKLGDDFTICSGEIVTLTAQVSNGEFVWNTGETTTAIEVSPTETTTYSVTATNGACGTEVVDEITITVNEMPVVDAGPDVEICIGSEVTLTATGSGNFLWSTGETTQSIVVSPSSTKIYSVSSSNGTCTVEDAVEVKVNRAPEVSLGPDKVICEGSSVVLKAEGFGNFLWSTGETTQSIRVNPTVTTTYSVVASTNNACSVAEATDEIVVYVNSTPEVNAGEDVTICKGESVTLTASGNGDFYWSTGQTGKSITVNPSSTKVYTVYAKNGSCYSAEDDVKVTVNSVASVNLGPNREICAGESITLKATGVGNFRWSNGATTREITVSPTSTTTYSVVATVEGTSCTKEATDEITVTVFDTAVVDVGPDITIDEGDSVTLTATGTGSFKWSTGATGRSIRVSPSATTIYTVEASTGGTCVASDQVKVTVIPKETDETSSGDVVAYAGEDKVICAGATLIITATGGDNYLWSTGETTASITVNPKETTLYSVTVSNSHSVDYDDVLITVDKDCSGTGNKLPLKEIKVYPNPSTGVVNLELTGYANTLDVSLFSMNGSRIYNEVIDNYSPDKVLKRSINLSGYGKGVYFIRLTNGGNVQTKKVLII